MDERSLRRRRASAPAARRDEALLKRLCAASAQALERELREGRCAGRDCEGRVHLRERMAGGRRADGRKGSAGRRSCPPSRAGDVTIEVRGGAEQRDDCPRRCGSARQLMAPYTEGGGFFFCAVKG